MNKISGSVPLPVPGTVFTFPFEWLYNGHLLTVGQCHEINIFYVFNSNSHNYRVKCVFIYLPSLKFVGFFLVECLGFSVCSIHKSTAVYTTLEMHDFSPIHGFFSCSFISHFN